MTEEINNNYIEREGDVDHNVETTLEVGGDLTSQLEELANHIGYVDKPKLMYINSGSDHNRGTTWDFFERSPFAGTIITPENRNQWVYIKAKEHKEKNPDATQKECLDWGKRFVNKEVKHHKAYLKGKNAYAYKGGKFLVEDESRLERFRRLSLEMEEKYKNIEEEKKENEVLNIKIESEESNG